MTLKAFTWPITLFLFGISITIIGSLFKILHWGWGFVNGSVLLSVGSFFEVLGIIFGIVVLLSSWFKK